MKIQPYIDKLNNSKKFKDFQTKNPKAYFAAGFFVLDFETKKMVTFMLDGREIEVKPGEAANQIIPKKINENINLDLDILKGLIQDEMKNQTITTKIQKIIAILQNLDNKLIWNLNCITTDMGIIKVHVDDESHSILKFEKINLFDIVKKL